MADKKKVVGLDSLKDDKRKILKTAQMIINRRLLANEMKANEMEMYTEGSGQDRDVYKALGYKKTLEFADYLNYYKRTEMGKRIVSAFPSACWHKVPIIREYGAEESDDYTPFEEAWAELVKNRRVFHYLERADRLAGIGRFGVILLGFDDVTGEEGFKLEVKPGSGRQLLYLRPYMESAVTIGDYEEDSGEERFGLPKTYKITSEGDVKFSAEVHHSRIIHIAEELEGNDVFGTPRLEVVFNRIGSLELVAGGSGEMFWRGAFPGYALEARQDAEFDEDDLEDLEEELQSFVHDLQRYVRLQGIEMKSLTPQVASPKEHFDVLVSLISAGRLIPKRILLGSERGELASEQDERAWFDRVGARCTGFCEPTILRAFVDKMIYAGVLPTPAEGYYVIWPDLTSKSDKEQATTAKDYMEALAKYVGAEGADAVIPASMVLRKYFDFTDDEIKSIEDMLATYLGEEEEGEEEPEEDLEE